MDRRTFTKITTSGLAIAISPSLITQTLFASNRALYKQYKKTLLVDKNGKAIKTKDLKVEVPYIFLYPYSSTPCFLLKLPKPVNNDIELTTSLEEKYIWHGGSGKNGNIVGYSAICTHALTHPTPEDSFITYVPKTGKTMAHKTGGVIVCSSHLSVYNPYKGGKNIAGSADDPLASIILEYDSINDELYAVGVLGEDRFHDLFKRHKPQLIKRYGDMKSAKNFVDPNSKTITLSQYSKDIIQY